MHCLLHIDSASQLFPKLLAFQKNYIFLSKKHLLSQTIRSNFHLIYRINFILCHFFIITVMKDIHLETALLVLRKMLLFFPVFYHPTTAEWYFSNNLLQQKNQEQNE